MTPSPEDAYPAFNHEIDAFNRVSAVEPFTPLMAVLTLLLLSLVLDVL